MKKMTKKLGAIVLALAMCFSLCCTALVSADDEPVEYTITISNAKIKQTYSAYKIFDATVELNSDGTAVTDENGNAVVAYSISDDNPIYDYVTKSYTEEGITYNSPFVFTKTTVINGVTTYTVTKAEGVSDSDIINYLNVMIGEVPVGTLTAAASKTAESNGELVLTLLEPGYYFVTSTVGTVVSITTTDPHAEIIEKNDVPSMSKEIKDGLAVDDTMHGDTEAIGDDVEFLVEAYVPLYTAADADSPEGYLVTDYEFNDHMSAGLEIRGLTQADPNDATGEGDYYTVYDAATDTTHYYATQSLISKWVTVYDNDGTTKCDLFGDDAVIYNPVLELTDASIYTEGDESGIQFDGFTFTYDTIPNKDDLNGTTYGTASEIKTNYPTNASLTIDYKAHVTEAAVYDNINEITMDWHVTTFKNPDTPKYGGEKYDRDDVYVLQLIISKVDGTTGTALSGAEFALSGTNLNDVVTSTTYTYTALESLSEYQAAKEAGTELWFLLIDDSTSTDNYTSKDPYDIAIADPSDPDLDNYVKNPYAEDPDYPEAAGYTYVAYVRTESTESGLQPAADRYVTGVTDSEGKLTFTGLTVGDWTLTEIKAPDGYNLVTEKLTFTISVKEWLKDEDGNMYPVWEFESEDDFSFNYDTATTTIIVANYQGTELPGTGGIGTTIFYIIGGVLVVGAGVVLITRRRMTRED